MSERRAMMRARAWRMAFFAAFIGVCRGVAAAEESKPPDAEAVKQTPAEEFATADRDGDRRLTLEELLADEPEKNQPRLRQQFVVLDFDGDQTLSWDEFRAAPGRAPLEERAAVPDPIAALKEAELAKWQELFTAADRDGDGALSRREWPARKIAAALPAIADADFALWDRDGDGRVDQAEGRWLFDVAYGITRPDGRPLRTPQGLVLNWSYLRSLDGDHDDFLSPDEFMPKYHRGDAGNPALFAKLDADHDGKLNDEEMKSLFWADALGLFLGIDADFDGYVATDELMKSVGHYAGGVALRTVRAFDIDGDGKLSFAEYRRTPFPNNATEATKPRADADYDGQLSWKEFYRERAPLMIALNRQFFERFDLDKNGMLSTEEFDLTIDFGKVSPEVALRAKDANGDGRIDLAELFSEKKPAGDSAALERYGKRLAEAEQRLKASDSDKNGWLNPAEFVAWHQAGIEAAQRQAREAARRKAADEFVKADRDGDRRLAMEEFLAGAAGDALTSKRRQFFVWDTDEDERLTLDELALRGEGVRLSPLNDFRRRDANGDRLLSLEELLAYEREANLSRLRQQFVVLDFDGSQSLSWEEFSAAPGRVALEARATVPDPLAALKEAGLAKWQQLFTAADRDGDEALSRREWPARKMAAALPALADVEFAMWDRDGDGRVDQAEGRWLFDVAYGFTRPDGRPLRTPQGSIFNWSYLRSLDADHDGFLSTGEFLPQYHRGDAGNPALFAKLDADRDGKLNDDEVRSLFWSDALGLFLGVDAGRDGYVTSDELMKSVGHYAGGIGQRTVKLFDADGDGKLSFAEYRLTPFLNNATDALRRRTDADNDGKLSWKEFYLESPPLMIGLNRHFFERFDLDKDGALSLNELDFTIDVNKAPPEIAIRAKDADGDGKVTFKEFFTEQKPSGADVRAMDRYELRLAAAENRFLSDDKDGSGYLDLKELIQSHQMAMEAARRRSSALSNRKTMLEGNYWARKSVLVVNQIAFLAIVWMVVRRTGRGKRDEGSAMRDEG